MKNEQIKTTTDLLYNPPKMLSVMQYSVKQEAELLIEHKKAGHLELYIACMRTALDINPVCRPSKLSKLRKQRNPILVMDTFELLTLGPHKRTELKSGQMRIVVNPAQLTSTLTRDLPCLFLLNTSETNFFENMLSRHLVYMYSIDECS